MKTREYVDFAAAKCQGKLRFHDNPYKAGKSFQPLFFCHHRDTLAPDLRTIMRFAVFLFLLVILPGTLSRAQDKSPAPLPPLPDATTSAPASNATIRGNYGDWQMRCEKFPNTPNEQCALFQTVAAQDRPNVGLMVIALRITEQKTEVLRVVAPLGVFLPSGLGLKIDDQNVGVTAFARCVPNGCMAEAKLDEALLNKLKTGKNATFVIFQTPEEGIGIPVSLQGFGEGYAKLQ